MGLTVVDGWNREIDSQEEIFIVQDKEANGVEKQRPDFGVHLPTTLQTDK